MAEFTHHETRTFAASHALADALSEVEGPARFAVGGAVDAGFPRIDIAGYGPLALPVREDAMPRLVESPAWTCDAGRSAAAAPTSCTA